MADSASKGGESLDALAARIDRLNQKMDQAKSAAGTAKAVSIVVAIVIAAAAIIGILILLGPLRAAFNNPEPYREALLAEFQDSVRPAIEAEIKANSERILKEVGNSAQAAFQARQEELFIGVNDELRTFTENMQEWGVDQIQTRRQRVRDYIEKAVVAEVPELQDPDKTELILSNAAGAMDSVVTRIMDEYLSGHMALMANIETQIAQFPIPEEYQDMSEDELTQEMVNQLGIYAMSVFADTINPQTRDFLRAALNEE